MDKIVNFFSDLLNILPPFHLVDVVKIQSSLHPPLVEKVVISVRLAADYTPQQAFVSTGGLPPIGIV